VVGSYSGGPNISPGMATSADGTNWTRRLLGMTNGELAAVTYGNGQWVAVGQEPVILSTPDCPYSVSSVALIFSSSDGMNWTRRESGLPTKSGLAGITWTGEEFVAAGFYNRMEERSVIITSPDGIAWQIRPSLGANLFQVAYGNSRVVAVSDHAGNWWPGALQVSDFIIPTPPELALRRFGLKIVLSWPSVKTGFTLQSMTNLIPPVTWIDSTQSPTTIGAEFVITNETSGSAQFFRLRQ
jgi:hypothetical protein